MDPAWPGRVFRPAAQPQRHLEGVQHQLGALVRGGGSADDLSRVDLHDESGVGDCGAGRPYLKPATWRRLGADTLKSDGCSPLLPGTVLRPALQRNGPAMAQRLAVAPTRILYSIRSHTAHLRPED